MNESRFILAMNAKLSFLSRPKTIKVALKRVAAVNSKGKEKIETIGTTELNLEEHLTHSSPSISRLMFCSKKSKKNQPATALIVIQSHKAEDDVADEEEADTCGRGGNGERG